MDRRHRLTSSRDFARVLRTGKRASSGPLSVAIGAGEQDRPPRIGVSVRLSTGGAVRRNRAKRLLREAARNHVAAFPSGSDIVVSGKDGMIGKSFQAVDESLRDALRKAGVRC